MNLALELHGVLLDKLYQTPTSITYWCIEATRYQKRNTQLKKHSPYTPGWPCYYKYENWCWKQAHSWCQDRKPVWDTYDAAHPRLLSVGYQNKNFTYDTMRKHLADVRTLLQAGATFCVI